MTFPHRPGGTALARPVSRLRTSQWTARRPSALAPQQPVAARRYEAMALLPGGEVVEVAQRAPSHPFFESAFAALARGTILGTEEGPVAIEDMIPGMKVETRDGGFQPVAWIGTMSIAPQMPFAHMPARLFRIPVDSFGPSRPMPDLMLAPHARLLHRSPKLQTAIGSEQALTTVTAFEDGNTVIRVAPVSPVAVYHLAFHEHHILRANGLEIESFHPGDDVYGTIGDDSIKLFMSFFPHLEALAHFGPLVAPRLTVQEYETVVAA